MNLAITMTAYRRAAYTREVLRALAACEGIADWQLLVNIEPGHDEVVAIFDAFDACESQLVVNRQRKGLNRNAQAVLMRARKLDGVVHLQDDTVPSPDALTFFRWAIEEVIARDLQSRDGHQITLASGYHRPGEEPTQRQSHQCHTRAIWTGWGWGTTRARLSWMLTHWCVRDSKSFRAKFGGYRATRREIYPQLSRIQNIGYQQSENRRSHDHHRTPWVADASQVGEPFRLE